MYLIVSFLWFKEFSSLNSSCHLLICILLLSQVNIWEMFREIFPSLDHVNQALLPLFTFFPWGCFHSFLSLAPFPSAFLQYYSPALGFFSVRFHLCHSQRYQHFTDFLYNSCTSSPNFPRDCISPFCTQLIRNYLCDPTSSFLQCSSLF